METREIGEHLRQSIYDALARHDYAGAREDIDVLAGSEPAEAASLRVSSYVEEGDAAGAEHALGELLRLCPGSIAAVFLRARVTFMGGNRSAALAILQELDGRELPRIWQEKVYNLMGQCCRFLGDSRGSTEYYLKASQAADSPELAALEYSNYLFNLHYLPALPPEQAREAAKGYDAFFRQVPHYFHRRRKKEQEKLRIGYVSPDFRDHVVMRFSYALLTAYNRERFKVYAYMGGKGDAMSCHVAEQVDGWCDISRSTPAEAARAIYEDRIDILVDLSGHTQNSCLPILACKPAPIQMSGIGYFASTGLSAVDYFLGDSFLDDEETGREFTEELLILPRSHFCYAPFHGNLPVGEAPCRGKGYVTFGSFNNFTKVNDDVLGIWAKILAAVPDAHLLLKAEVFDHEDSRELALQRIRAAGIDLGRVELRGLTREYLPEYRDMDIALDTFPYPGGGTTCDALYMGVPVVTLRGRGHGGRFGWSLLHNIGLGELCAADLEEYVERAVMLAGDRELLAALRKNLRDMMIRSPLMDRKGYMADLEQGYEMVWEHFLSRQEPPLLREAPRLSILMDRLAKSGEKQQALAVADALLAAKPPSRSIAESLCFHYLDAEEKENAAAAVSLLPEGYPLGTFLRAKSYFLQKDMAESERLCREVMAGGGLEFPWSGLDHRLMAEIGKFWGDVELAAEQHRLAAVAMHKVSLESDRDEFSNYLLMLHYTRQTPEFIFRESCRYPEYLGEIRPFRHDGRKQHDRLRVGYISPDFRRHVVACFSQAFFHGADHARFRVYGYANCLEDDVSRNLAETADVWRNVKGMAPRDIAKLIYEDEIDILVDLSGHTGHNSLAVLAFRPAPVQVCGIGYFSTTGIPAVDYFLADRYTAPAGEEAFFTEKLLRLPHSHLCYRQVIEVPEIAPGLPCDENGFITFGSMNNMNKASDEVLMAWGRILAAMPDARLFLKHGALDDEARRERELSRMRQMGIDVSRVVLEGFTLDYLKEYRRMDIALDTFPYPGGGTTCDALYMGVPVIALAGGSNHGRFGLSLLENIGLGDLCGRSAEEYVRVALALAGDLPRLREIHAGLRGRMEESAVMNPKIYMKDLEDAYELIWGRYVKNRESWEEKKILCRKY